jgi:cell wall-associated NlpC family hydrolase
MREADMHHNGKKETPYLSRIREVCSFQRLLSWIKKRKDSGTPADISVGQKASKRFFRVKKRLSQALIVSVRLLPSFSVVLVLATLVFYLTVGPGAATPLVKQIPLDNAASAQGDTESTTTWAPFEKDLSDFDEMNRGRYWDSWYQAKQTEPTGLTEGPTETTAVSPAVSPTSAPEPTATPTLSPTPVPVEVDTDGVVQEPLPVDQFKPDDTKLYVRVFEANIRKQPRTDVDILLTATMGDVVKRTGIGDYWDQVELENGQTGYVYQELVTTEVIYPVDPAPTPAPAEPTAAPTPAPTEPTDGLERDANGVIQEPRSIDDFDADETTLYVKVSQANIRSEPRTDAAILLTATTGDTLLRTGIGDYWDQVKLADGQTGYVYQSLVTTEVILEPTPTPTPTPQDPSSGLTDAQKQEIVDLARSCLGIKYVYGGESLSGMDCSGFTTYIYKTLFNITLPRRAKDQAYAGTGVSSGNIQIGDIICFDWSSPYGECDHVGLYIGGGQYIHASYSRGKVVESTVNFSRNPIVSIRRIIP